MRHEQSCGAVVYTVRDGELLFLIEHMQKGHTSLCKGHVEPGETEQQTARREIREETGLDVQFQNGFREQIQYSPAPDVTKTVVFFLAFTEHTDAVPQPEEVASIEFLPFDRALAALTYGDDRRVLTAARDFLARPAGRG